MTRLNLQTMTIIKLEGEYVVCLWVEWK